MILHFWGRFNSASFSFLILHLRPPSTPNPGLPTSPTGGLIMPRNRSSTSIHMYPYPSFRRRRMHAMNSFERRRTRHRQRNELDASTEDDVSDWSGSLMKTISKPRGALGTGRLSCDSVSSPSWTVGKGMGKDANSTWWNSSSCSIKQKQEKSKQSKFSGKFTLISNVWNGM